MMIKKEIEANSSVRKSFIAKEKVFGTCMTILIVFFLKI